MAGKEVVFDLDAAAFSSDEFRIYQFKVKRCPRARPHDWTQCPFAHPGEKAKRRDPGRYRYSGTACPEFRRNGSCRRGDACPFAHGVFECWLHPSRYRTQMCTDGAGCKRRVCFFAHTEGELRKPEEDPVWLQQQLQAEATAEQQVQQQVQALKIFAALLGSQSTGNVVGGSLGLSTGNRSEAMRNLPMSSLATLLGINSMPGVASPGTEPVQRQSTNQEHTATETHILQQAEQTGNFENLLNLLEHQSAAKPLVGTGSSVRQTDIAPLGTTHGTQGRDSLPSSGGVKFQPEAAEMQARNAHQRAAQQQRPATPSSDIVPAVPEGSHAGSSSSLPAGSRAQLQMGMQSLQLEATSPVSDAPVQGVTRPSSHVPSVADSSSALDNAGSVQHSSAGVDDSLLSTGVPLPSINTVLEPGAESPLLGREAQVYHAAKDSGASGSSGVQDSSSSAEPGPDVLPQMVDLDGGSPAPDSLKPQGPAGEGDGAAEGGDGALLELQQALALLQRGGASHLLSTLFSDAPSQQDVLRNARALLASLHAQSGRDAPHLAGDPKLGPGKS